ncbi:putative DNA-binding transcriptional regulator [compost metagenome]
MIILQVKGDRMLMERIKSCAKRLTLAEQKLVRELLARPREAALGTASELAKRVGVHEATASRLAKKLGFDSYALFRDTLRHEFIVKTDPAGWVRNTLATMQGPSILGELIEQEAIALARLSEFVTDEKLEAAAQILAHARKIFIFAHGNAEALAVLADKRLRRMGLDTVMLSGDGRDLAERLVDLEDADAILAFTNRRPPRHWASLARYAKDVEVRTIVIADAVGPSLVPEPDHLLFAPRGGSEDSFQSLNIPMTITNALVLQLALLNEMRSMERLERVGQLMAIMDG